jgi:protein disulfide-isomerase
MYMVSAAVGQPSAVRWQWNLETAKQIAVQSNRLVLIHFWAEWCGPCQAMERMVFSRPEVAAALEREYVPCRLNLDQFPSTANQYGVTKIPTDVIITPQGQMIARFVGAADVSQYLDRIGRVAASRRGDPSRMVAQIPGGPSTEPARPATNPPADAPTGEFCRTNSPISTQPQLSPVNPPYAGQPNYPGPAQGPQTPVESPILVSQQSPLGAQGGYQPSPTLGNSGASIQTPSPPAVELPPGSPPLALDGYCPVQLTENERWVLGNRRWGAIHEGRTYLFTGPEEQNRFLADPTHFAPVFCGDDVVKLVDEGKRVPGSRLHGAWFHGKVYLFVSEDSYQRFDRNPFRYVSKLEAAGSVADRPPASGYPNGGNLSYSNGVAAPPYAGRPPLR